MLDAEILDLYEENQTTITQSNTTAYLRSDWPNLSSAFSSMDLDDNSNKDDFLPNSNSSSDDTSLLPLGYIFSQSSLAQIQDYIAHVVILSWVDQPPSNLGHKIHGKLKADQWLILFTIFLSLIVRIANSWAGIKPTAPLLALDKKNSIKSSYISYILLIQLLHGLCTTFPQLSYDFILCDVTVWHLFCDVWHFPALLPCVVSPKEKEKEKKRNISNDLAILPSHDTTPLSRFLVQRIYSS